MVREDNNPRDTYKPVDIKEIFISKSPGLAKIIPGFIYRYITRILHIDFLNDLLKRQGHLEGIPFIDQVIKEFSIKEHIYGLDNIPPSGRYIFASNHPLGGFDGLLLMKTVNGKLGNVKFLTNDILMNIPQMKSIFVPVNKHGGHSREAARLLDQAYKSDDQILIFPSGLASRKIKGKIVDLEWKKHFISKAIQYKRDIVPVFVAGRNSNRFYRLAKIRKLLKIKWNLEMFFLPDETMRHKGTDVHLYFGKPVSYKTFNKSKTHYEWAARMKELTYSLPQQFDKVNY
ncbi:MAG: glycerol acyltransferase [Bacteroidales bacterium]|nr:glycerol acyltransferase [Bacteroidales bacterium]